MEASALPHHGRVRLPLGKALLVPLGDEALVEHVRAGNERAFEVVYDRYHAGLFAFCRHMLGSRDEAEDALQQVFVSAHADLLRSRRPITLKAWLYTIARNRCVSMLRARREHASDLLELHTDGPAAGVEQRLELRDLMHDLRQLPREQREALVLAEIGDLSHAEIGRVIGCEAARVKSLIFQARSKLIESRKARETPCAEIREQLATMSGGALRRGALRRHLKACPGCAEFREEVRRQRAMLAMLLPVVPSIALKHSVLAAAGISSAGGGSAGSAGLVAGVAAKGAVAKLAAGVLVGAVAVGGGIAVEEGVLGHGSGSTPSGTSLPAPAALQHRANPLIAPLSVPARGIPFSAQSLAHGKHKGLALGLHRRHHGRALARGHAKHHAAPGLRRRPASSNRRALGRTKAEPQVPSLGQGQPLRSSSPSQATPVRSRERAPSAVDPASPILRKVPPGRALGTAG